MRNRCHTTECGHTLGCTAPRVMPAVGASYRHGGRAANSVLGDAALVRTAIRADGGAHEDVSREADDARPRDAVVSRCRTHVAICGDGAEQHGVDVDHARAVHLAPRIDHDTETVRRVAQEPGSGKATVS